MLIYNICELVTFGVLWRLWNIRRRRRRGGVYTLSNIASTYWNILREVQKFRHHFTFWMSLFFNECRWVPQVANVWRPGRIWAIPTATSSLGLTSTALSGYRSVESGSKDDFLFRTLFLAVGAYLMLDDYQSMNRQRHLEEEEEYA